MIFLDLFACLIRDVNFCPRAVGPIGESRILRTENPIGGWILAEAVRILRILASLPVSRRVHCNYNARRRSSGGSGAAVCTIP